MVRRRVQTSGRGRRNRLDARGKTRKLTRNRIAMQNTLCHRSLHFRLCALESGCCLRLVSTRNRQFHLAKKGADTRAAHAVALGALLGLTNALARGSIIGHGRCDAIAAGVERQTGKPVAGGEGLIPHPHHRQDIRWHHRLPVRPIGCETPVCAFPQRRTSPPFDPRLRTKNRRFSAQTARLRPESSRRRG